MTHFKILCARLETMAQLPLLGKRSVLNTIPSPSSLTNQVMSELNARLHSEMPAKRRKINGIEKWLAIPLSVLIRHDFMNSSLLTFESVDRMFVGILKEKVHIGLGYICIQGNGEPVEKEMNILDADDYASCKDIVSKIIQLSHRFGYFIHLRLKYPNKTFDSFAQDVSLMADYRKEEVLISKLIASRAKKPYKRGEFA